MRIPQPGIFALGTPSLAALERRSTTAFARIDHAGGAHQVGHELPGETVLVFGNPQAGTPLMEANPQVGIALPLRVLVWDDVGTTMVGYQDPVRLADEYALGSVADVLGRMQGLLAELVAEAAN